MSSVGGGGANPAMHHQDIQTSAGFVGASRQAFFVQFWPAEAPRAHVLYLPPFGEEMNRCRAMAAQQARTFARAGLSCSILDYYGTGESHGELRDANLAVWRQNIEDLWALVSRRQDAPFYLWGCRLGALLALDFLASQPTLRAKLLFWQPVASGRAYVTQLLRQRTATLMQKGEKTETSQDMRAQLAAGKSIEVGGYALGGELLNALDTLEVSALLAKGLRAEGLEIVWFEHVADAGGMPGAKTGRIIGELENAGAQVVVNTFTGDPVWQLHKRAECEELLAKTRELSL